MARGVRICIAKVGQGVFETKLRPEVDTPFRKNMDPKRALKRIRHNFNVRAKILLIDVMKCSLNAI